MTEGARKRLKWFSENTFTIEMPDDAFTQELQSLGYISRHPGGPFGSRSSYYRTELGIMAWNNIQEKY